MHPTDLELVEWVDGNLRGTPQHGEIALHLMGCKGCAGLLLGQAGRNADVAYELLRTSWRMLATDEGRGGGGSPMSIWLADQQPCADKHTPDPSGYLAWFEWAEKMAKTHKPTRCPDCKLWAIWVPIATDEGRDRP